MHSPSLISLLFFLFVPILGFSQTEISGTVRNQEGLLLENAVISITAEKNSPLIAFAISDSIGKFTLHFAHPADSIVVKATYLGFSPEIRVLENSSQSVDLKLSTTSMPLNEVVLKSDPVKRIADTLNYTVTAFQDQNDRVIADVLNKMPGIQVEKNGRILYKGEPIEKFYIEGLDLLEGKYNLATNNLSADAVSRVQILENHQPVKILDSLVFSRKASLNLRLKKEITTTGSFRAGVGGLPLNYDTGITPMLFSKKHQAILSYQSNTIGKDVSRDLQDLTINIQNNLFDTPDFMLSAIDLAPPPFSDQLWKENNVHLGSINLLTKLRNNTEFKISASYTSDRQYHKGEQSTRILTHEDTIVLHEKISNSSNLSNFKTDLIWERNQSGSFFRNELRMNQQRHHMTGMLIPHQKENIEQDLQQPLEFYNHNLKWIRPWRNRLMEITSRTQFTRNKEALDVTGKPNQELSLQQFSTINTLGIIKGSGKLTLSPKVGWSFMDQHLITEMEATSESSGGPPKKSVNNLKFSHLVFFMDPDISYQTGNWKLLLKVPAKVHYFRLSEMGLLQENTESAFTIEPSIAVHKEYINRWDFNLGYKATSNYKTIENLHSGLILKNYRRLERFNVPMALDTRHHYYSKISYRHPSGLFFSNAGYSYTHFKTNVMLHSQIGENGIRTVQAFEQENAFNSHQFKLGSSLYLNQLRSTTSLNFHYSENKRRSLLNDILTEIGHSQLSAIFQLESNPFPWISLGYSAEFKSLRSFLLKEKLSGTVFQKDKLDLTLYPNNLHYLGISAEWIRNTKTVPSRSPVLLNLDYQYKFPKKGMDLILKWNNVLNQKYFQKITHMDYSLSATRYHLLSSYLHVQFNFSF